MSILKFTSPEINLLTFVISGENDPINFPTNPDYLIKIFGDTYYRLIKAKAIVNKKGVVKITDTGYDFFLKAAEKSGEDEFNTKFDEKDWNTIALLFAKALGMILDEDEGVVLNATGDLYFGDPNITSIIVFNSDGQIRVIENTDNLPEGSRVKLRNITE